MKGCFMNQVKSTEKQNGTTQDIPCTPPENERMEAEIWWVSKTGDLLF